MAEYRQREQQYAKETMGALIAAFANNVNNAHQENQVMYADFVQRITAMKNLDWAISVGILTMEQALTLMANIPVASIVNMDVFGFKEATLDLEMRVSASTEEKTSVGVDTSTEASVKIGGIAKLFGAGGSVKIKADTTYKKEVRRESDYSSTARIHILMERMAPPEGVQKMLDMQNEVVVDAMKINKTIISKQVEQLNAEVDNADVPQTLPETVDEGEDT